MTLGPLRRAVVAGVVGPPLLVGLLVGSLGGCARPQTPGRQAAEAQRTACRHRADEVYAKQNRDQMYRADSDTSDTRDSPFSTSGLPGITTRGLSGEYQRDNMVSDCIDDAAGNVGNSGNEAPTITGAAATPGHLPPTLSPLAVPPLAGQ